MKVEGGRDLWGLMSPRGVAVVGASSNLESISGRPLKLLLKYGYGGGVYPVNPKYDSIGGLRCYPDVGSIDGDVDVALVAVRAPLVPSVIEGCGRRGIRFAVVFSSGFAEAGREDLQRELLEAADRWGVRILGPNCQGLVNLAGGIPLSFSASLDTDRLVGATPGGIAYVSQSGAFGFASFACAVDRGVRFRHVVTTGNQADLDTVEVAGCLLEDPEVRMLLLYLEGVRDGDRLVELLIRARERDVTVGLIKAGRSETGSRAAQSHTASVAGDQRVWGAVMEQYGAVMLGDMEDMISLGLACGLPRPRGRRVGIITTSGGAGIMMADLCSDQGLQVPLLDEGTQERIRRVIPPFGSPANPVDVTAQVINDPQGMTECLSALEADPNVDMMSVVISMITGQAGESTARQVADFAASSRKPLVCSWLIDREHGGDLTSYLSERGVPVIGSLRQAAWTLGAISRPRGSFLSGDLPGLPCDDPLRGLEGLLTEHQAKQVLKAWGVPVTMEEMVRDPDEARVAAERIGYPVALKVMSRQIPHKTDAGVVALNVKGPGELKEAFDRVMDAARRVQGARLDGVLVQRMASGVECIVGVKRDPVFGPVVVFGLGGVLVEVLKDVAVRRAPVSPEEALEMIRSLRGYPIFGPFRGRGPLDQGAVAEVISRVSILAMDPRLLELDVNPLFVMEEGQGVVCADALMNVKGE
ncbi:CoA-binding domain protein [Thermanaerovibrio acidaminovorans DSM 6589]|uniref:CoA-binding domain protein n=1 Tax=Thermanaerovibrio acidaminovorans (strain ATCC 49978 / DSM 6589 / Su883) TaxID=525903 RepID=D1B6J7_THEAS|nr:CoA-binding domain protein [Thermanaerovibrio acidaminovorans DSM 6589]